MVFLKQQSVDAFAIVTSNDLQATIFCREGLGFERVVGADQYVLMTGWECEVHLTQA